MSRIKKLRHSQGYIQDSLVWLFRDVFAHSVKLVRSTTCEHIYNAQTPIKTHRDDKPTAMLWQNIYAMHFLWYALLGKMSRTEKRTNENSESFGWSDNTHYIWRRRVTRNNYPTNAVFVLDVAADDGVYVCACMCQSYFYTKQRDMFERNK